jgi:hypothetical protein
VASNSGTFTSFDPDSPHGRQKERNTGTETTFGTPHVAKAQERWREAGTFFSEEFSVTSTVTTTEEGSVEGAAGSLTTRGEGSGVEPTVTEPTLAGGSVFLRKGQNQDIYIYEI